MATVKLAKLQKGDGKTWNVVTPAGTVENFPNAEAAAVRLSEINDPIETELAAKEAAKSAPVNCSVTARGQFNAFISRNIDGDDVGGKFPALNVTGKQMEVLIAHWPAVVEAYTAHKAKIVARWQDLPASERKTAAKA